MRKRQGHSLSPLLLLFLLAFAVEAFQSSCPRIFHVSATSASPHILFSRTSSDDKQKQSEEGLSEMDARVLKSMLQDSEKLDLKTEDSLKKLLERGVVSKKVPQAEKPITPGTDSDTEFSSQVLQTLSDTKVWQAVSRKAENWFESAKLYVQNRVERDAMTLAALGLFAWERAIRDVGRALPAAGASGAKQDTQDEKQKPLLLSEKSSFEDIDMTTPLDELKSVGSAVADILRKGGDAGTSTSPSPSNTGVLRTAATSRQDKRNFQRSYERQQQTQNPAQAASGVAAGLTDTAWQLKRELQAEVNAPGYKTKQVQSALEAASDSTRQLLQGAKETWKLQQAKQKQLLDPSKNNMVEEVDEDAGATEFIDIATEEVDATPEPTQQKQQQQQQESKREIEARKRRERRQAEQQQQQQLRMQQQQQQQAEALKIAKEQWNQLQLELQAESFRLKDQLQNCIANPEQTWLRADIVKGVQQFDQALIKTVVTEMISTRNSLKELIKRQANSSGQDMHIVGMQDVLQELNAIQLRVEELRCHATAAVSPAASEALKEILLGMDVDESESRLETLRSRLEQLVKEVPNYPTIEEADVNPDLFYATTPHTTGSEAEVAEQEYEVFGSTTVETDTAAPADTSASTAVEPEIVDVIPEAFVYAVATTPMEIATAAKERAPSSGGSFSSVVELVTDDDFEAAVGGEATKNAVAVDQNDTDKVVAADKEAEDNFAFTLLLRALDILFFLLEKTFTVAIPTVITSSGTAKDRLDEVARGGLGSEGWQRIGNAKAGSKRY